MKANTRNMNSLKVEDTNLRKTVLSLSLPMLLSSLATSIANVGLPTLT